MNLYRYSDFMGEDGITLRLEEFKVVRSTEKTYFIKRDKWSKRVKQCRKGALRSFAYDTKEKAFDSYMQRKGKQLWHAEVAAQTAKLAIKEALKHKDLLVSGYGGFVSVMGKPEFYQYVHFD